MIPPKQQYLHCNQEPICLLSFELHVYLIEVMESMSKGLLFATKLVIVALAV